MRHSWRNSPFPSCRPWHARHNVRKVTYGFIGRFQAFDGRGKTASILARELFGAYRKNKQTQGVMANALVGLFEQSTSFAAAKDRLGYLEEFESWSPSFSSRLKAALRSNSQISDAWGVPDRVTALIRKWAGQGA